MITTLGARLKAARFAHGLSQSALAKKLSVTRAAIWQFERDDIHPRPELLTKLARVLGCTPEWLECGVGVEPFVALCAYLDHAVTDLRRAEGWIERAMATGVLDETFGDGPLWKLVLNTIGNARMFAADTAEAIRDNAPSLLEEPDDG